MILTSKEVVAPVAVQRAIGLRSYRSAWFLSHRIRTALADNDFRRLMGITAGD
jgi:hypothetical protein